MFKNWKNIAAVFILVSSMVVSVLIIKTKSQEAGPGIRIPGESNETAKLFPSKNQGKDGDRLILTDIDKENDGEINTDNLTDIIAQSYVKKIIEMNPGAPEEIGEKKIKAPSPDSFQVSGELVAQKIEQIFETNYFSEKDIMLSNNNSIETQLRYINEIGVISEKNFKGFDKSITEITDNWIDYQDASGIRSYIAIASAQMDDLLSIEIPLIWKPFHIQNLNLWKKKEVVFKAMIDINNDPFKTMVAMEKMPDILEETANLQLVLNRKIIDLASDL